MEIATRQCSGDCGQEVEADKQKTLLPSPWETKSEATALLAGKQGASLPSRVKNISGVLWDT